MRSPDYFPVTGACTLCKEPIDGLDQFSAHQHGIRPHPAVPLNHGPVQRRIPTPPTTIARPPHPRGR